MMDSFVEAQNNLRRMSDAGCFILFKTRQSSLLVHADGHEVTGLKTYRCPKRKEQLGVCSLPGFCGPEVVGRECCLGAPDRSVVINNTLAMERRGGRGSGGAPMLVRSLARAAA